MRHVRPTDAGSSGDAGRMERLRELQGQRVSLALAGGGRIDDAQLISAGRRGLRTIWVFTNGVDAFLPLGDVVEVWEARAA